MKNKKTPDKTIHGKRISRKKALEGLGNPKKWAKAKEKVLAEFRTRPVPTWSRAPANPLNVLK